MRENQRLSLLTEGACWRVLRRAIAFVSVLIGEVLKDASSGVSGSRQERRKGIMLIDQLNASYPEKKGEMELMISSFGL